MSNNTDQILTWPDFKDLVTKLAETKATYYCRGQSDDSWKLTASFHRRANSLGLSLENYLDAVIPEVHYEVSAALDFTFDLQDEVAFGAFLALCQHHGFPTPLLDWTLSPYIAAYFAFRGVKESGHSTDHVKLFLFDHVGWFQTYTQPLNLRIAAPYISLIRPFATLNYRILPQQGTFTVTNVPDMEAHIRRCEQSAKKQFLSTVRISVKAKPTAMQDLSLMGITDRALFPGLDGLFAGLANRLLAGEMGETTPEMIRRLAQPKREPVAADPMRLLGVGALGSIPPPSPPAASTTKRPK